jgi:hypothetical protein
MSCSLDRILNNDSFCEYKDKTNATMAAVEANCAAIADKGLRLSVIGTATDDDTVFNTIKLASFSDTPFDPLSGFSSARRYTIQAGDDGVFDISASVGLLFQPTGDTFFEVSIFKNNVSVAAISMAVVNNDTQWRPQINKILDLVAGDYIEIAVATIGTSSNGFVLGAQNVFEIRKI